MQILIATHGDFAKGIYSSIEIIIGSKEHVTCINAYSEEKNINTALEQYFANYQQEEIIVITDLFGGSVNQAIMNHLNQQKIYLITGLNLPLLLEVTMMNPEEPVNEEQLRTFIEGSRRQILYVNDTLKSSIDDDFD